MKKQLDQARNAEFSMLVKDMLELFFLIEKYLKVETFNTKLHSVWRGWHVSFTDEGW